MFYLKKETIKLLTSHVGTGAKVLCMAFLVLRTSFYSAIHAIYFSYSAQWNLHNLNDSLMW